MSKTLDDRIKECKESKGTYLDLNNMKLKKIPFQLPKTLKYLFLSENNIKKIGDLSYLTELEVLDLSFNKLKTVPKLPPNLHELSCKSNRLTSIDTYDMKILDCSMNMLKKIEFKGEILDCSKNAIKTIKCTDRLKKLFCAENKLKDLPLSNNMTELDCTKNRISSVPHYSNLKSLLCDYNRIDSLSKYDELDFLICNNNNIEKLTFMPKLKEIICDKNMLISRNYNIIEKVTMEYNGAFMVRMRFV